MSSSKRVSGRTAVNIVVFTILLLLVLKLRWWPLNAAIAVFGVLDFYCYNKAPYPERLKYSSKWCNFGDGIYAWWKLRKASGE